MFSSALNFSLVDKMRTRDSLGDTFLLILALQRLYRGKKTAGEKGPLFKKRYRYKQYRKCELNHVTVRQVIMESLKLH